MRRTILILAPFLAAATVIASAPAGDDAAQRRAPRIVVDQPRFDAGKIVQGDTVEAVFIVRNTGDAELAILSAQPS